MTIRNAFNDKHREAWRRIRRRIFQEDTATGEYVLASIPEYPEIVEKVALSLAKNDVENQDFQDFLKMANESQAKSYVKNTGTQFKNIYELCSYAYVYGMRSVMDIYVTLLEYFLDPCSAQYEDEVRILDLGYGTGATMFGLLLFFKEYSKNNRFFKRRVKKIIIDCVDKDPNAYIFCDELKKFILGDIANEQEVEINIYDKDIVMFLSETSSKRYNIIVASKSISELSCAISLDWPSYKDVLHNILKLVDEEGVFIIIEALGGQKMSLIGKTAKFIQELGWFIYSPCVPECERPDCWGWKVFKYSQPAIAGEIQDIERPTEKFYSLLIAKTEHHISQDIVGFFGTREQGQLEYVGILNPNTGTCISDKFLPEAYPEEKRGKYLFKNTYGDLWTFGVDNLWKELPSGIN